MLSAGDPSVQKVLQVLGVSVQLCFVWLIHALKRDEMSSLTLLEKTRVNRADTPPKQDGRDEILNLRFPSMPWLELISEKDG